MGGINMSVFDLLKNRIDKMEEKRDVKGLILTLKDDDETIRKEAARALGNLGSSQAIEPLTITLQDPDKGVREEAINALGKIDDPQVIKPLAYALDSQFISLRWKAAQALGKIGSQEAIEPLTTALQDPDKDVKEEAIIALGRITINPYLEDLENDAIEVREDAINKIKHLEQEETIPMIEDTPEEEPSPDPKEDKPPQIDEEHIPLNERLEELKNKGYYHLVEKFVRKSRYEPISQGTDDLKPSDLQKLKKLLAYQGLEFQDGEILRIIQGEIKNQRYQEFEEKIMKTQPTSKEDYLEEYLKNYHEETEDNLENLDRLLRKDNIPIEDLKKQIEELRGKREIEEFECRLLETSAGTSKVKDSPSIVLKFIKKELIEKKEELFLTGNYGYIENFVQISKYDYHINDLEKLRKLLKQKGMDFQYEEILWLIQGEIENQRYHEFEEKIMENYPTTKQHYLEQYIENYPPEDDANLENLEKLLQKKKITSLNLEKEVKEVREKDEIREFEKKLSHEQDSPYESLPVIESQVSEDKALKNAQILSNLGLLYYDMGKHDEALGYLDQAINTYPDYIRAWRNKGLIYYTMGRPQKAVTCFYHILTLDAEYGEVWLDIGAILFEMGQTREATLCYQKALHVQHGDKKELSRYTLEFLSKNSFYKDNFNKFLDASSELKEETLDSPSTISKIMQML